MLADIDQNLQQLTRLTSDISHRAHKHMFMVSSEGEQLIEATERFIASINGPRITFDSIKSKQADQENKVPLDQEETKAISHVSDLPREIGECLKQAVTSLTSAIVKSSIPEVAQRVDPDDAHSARIWQEDLNNALVLLEIKPTEDGITKPHESAISVNSHKLKELFIDSEVRNIFQLAKEVELRSFDSGLESSEIEKRHFAFMDRLIGEMGRLTFKLGMDEFVTNPTLLEDDYRVNKQSTFSASEGRASITKGDSLCEPVREFIGLCRGDSSGVVNGINLERGGDLLLRSAVRGLAIAIVTHPFEKQLMQGLESDFRQSRSYNSQNPWIRAFSVADSCLEGLECLCPKASADGTDVSEEVENLQGIIRDLTSNIHYSGIKRKIASSFHEQVVSLNKKFSQSFNFGNFTTVRPVIIPDMRQ